MEQFPGDLKGDEGLAGAGGEGEQDARLAGGDGFQHAVDGDVLVIAAGVGAAFVLKRNGGETVAPDVLLGVGLGPEFGGGRVAGQFALGALVHVDAVEALAIGGISETNREFPRVVLGLGDTEGEGFGPGFGLDDGEFGVAVDEDVIGDGRLAAAAVAFEAAEGDGVFAADAAAFDHAPTGRREGGVDMLGAGFGFVHGWGLELAGEGLMEQ